MEITFRYSSGEINCRNWKTNTRHTVRLRRKTSRATTFYNSVYILFNLFTGDGPAVKGIAPNNKVSHLNSRSLIEMNNWFGPNTPLPKTKY